MIMRDLVKTLSAVLSVLVVIIVSRKFIRVLEQVIEGQISTDTLLVIFGLKMLIACVTFLPAATFMAILMVLGRLYRDHEMAAIASAGGGMRTIYGAIFLVLFPLSVAASYLSLDLAPWAENQIELRTHHDKESADIRGLVAGKFSEYSHGDLVFYVEHITPDKQLAHIFVQQRQHDSVAIINAQSGYLAHLDGGQYIVLKQGERVLGKPGDLRYTIETFDEYAVRIDTKVTPLVSAKQATPFESLWQASDRASVAEIQRRLAVPLGILLLGFIAVPLAELSPRGGVYGNMLIGFIIYFSYGNLLSVSQSWVLKQTLPAWLGLLSVNGLLCLVGLLLLGKFYGWRWLKQSLFEKFGRRA
ncbi:MAG TPA: LPS export ABC transporter permease LptF [Methylococcaceae bacterium]|nr:LPS export ABC transporter permease LptF [Methylococcaceae bacterium]